MTSYYSLNNDKLKTIEFHKVCRMCLRQTSYLRSIRTGKTAKMLEYCAIMEISEADNLPENICIMCSRLITKFYMFKLQIAKTEKILRNYLTEASKINSDENAALDETACTDTNADQPDGCLSSNKYINEEDIPLSERLWPKDINRNQNDDTETDNFLKFKNVHIDQFVKLSFCKGDVSNSQIFSNGPPPLVPLDPSDLGEQCDTSKVVTVNISKDIPPPLVPIKPGTGLAECVENYVTDTPKLTFSCTSCNNIFGSVSELRRHKLFECNSKILQCSVCKKVFKERRKLINHLKGHMVTRNYGCKICGKRYPSPSTFKVHMRSHTGERPFKCDQCGKGFAKWAGVVCHLKSHKSEKPFVCKTCGRSFKVASNLERHKILHADVLPYCCNYCGRTFSQSENLQLHIRTYHTHERPHLCYECGKGFVSSTRLNRHMWTHSGYKPYICNMCPKSYTNSNDLKLHQRSHLVDKGEAQKQYACPACNLKFFHLCRLTRHMKTHDKPFNCEVCAKGFNTVKSLQKHTQKVHLEKEHIHNVEHMVVDYGD